MTQEMKFAWVDHIPVIWFEPESAQPNRRLAIFLSGLTGTKENNIPYLKDLAQAGFVALSFDNWEHGERTTLTPEQVGERSFGNFRRYMWVNIGQTAVDTLIIKLDGAVARTIFHHPNPSSRRGFLFKRERFAAHEMSCKTFPL